ncbi:LysR family transcriptional regulator [Marinoscillum luteum]|uniref:LysR family transcriptional regulator n=1 Tax=Marinoscillum luteum TaxID=861051 RepID=A0ABW7NDB7_9BACT
MELKHFRLIKAIADEGNIANSAERLFLTQSALSHQLRSVEENLGVKIFIRNRKEWELTEEGQELYHLATSVLNSVDKKLMQIKHFSQSTGGNIKAGSECYSFYLLFPSFLQRMSALYPQISIDLNFDATHQPLSKLLSYEVDIAMVTRQPGLESLSSVEVLQDELFAVMHKENPLSQREYLEARDFTDQHLLIHSFPLETVSVYETYLKPNDVLPKKISAIPLTEVSLEMINANMGITCIPKWTLKHVIYQKELVFKPISRNGLKRSLFLVMRNEDLSKKHFTDFICNFEETIAQEFPENRVTDKPVREMSFNQ